MGAGSIIIIVIVSLVLLYVGITTGVLWTILGGLFTLIGNCIWALLKGIGCAIGSLLGNLLAGIATGILAVLKVIALPALIIGVVIFIGMMIWKAFFDKAS